MKRLLIVWHSRTGAASGMAQAAAQAAAADKSVETRLVAAVDAKAENLLAADGYIFAAPENLAALSGPMKDFFDRNYYPVLGQIEGRPYAILVAAGSDGAGAVRQIERIVTGWRLKLVADPIVVCTHAQTPERILAPKTIKREDAARCGALGATMAAGLGMGVF